MATKITYICDVCAEGDTRLQKAIIWINGQQRNVEACATCIEKLAKGIDEFFLSSGEQFEDVRCVVNIATAEGNFICGGCSYSANKSDIEHFLFCPMCRGRLQDEC